VHARCDVFVAQGPVFASTLASALPLSSCASLPAGTPAPLYRMPLDSHCRLTTDDLRVVGLVRPFALSPGLFYRFDLDEGAES
jgi:hypothetical protein